MHRRNEFPRGVRWARYGFYGPNYYPTKKSDTPNDPESIAMFALASTVIVGGVIVSAIYLAAPAAIPVFVLGLGLGMLLAGLALLVGALYLAARPAPGKQEVEIEMDDLTSHKA